MPWNDGPSTKFFAETLRAPLNNPAWSWGAASPEGNVVYLRVWEDHVEEVDGATRVLLSGSDWDGASSHGLKERHRHLQLTARGVPTYGIVCRSTDPGGVKRKIKDFEDAEVLEIGGLDAEDESIYGIVTQRVPVAEVVRDMLSSVGLDLAALLRDQADRTTRERLVDARLGQGRFRREVLAAWDDRCAVTGVETVEAIRASHIKPWRDCTDAERLDVNNGLPLVASLDALFDVGLISFADDRSMLVSEALPERDADRLIGRRRLLRLEPSDAQRAYLAFHREEVFRKLL